MRAEPLMLMTAAVAVRVGKDALAHLADGRENDDEVV
jgi:hypothetical protein